jgi:peptide/nickel transport system permease protein
MRYYVIRRLLLLIPTLLITSLIIFFIIRLIPGDIIDMMLTQNESTSHMDRGALEHALGLDVPVVVQYGRWMRGILLHGDFGNSLWKKTPVIEEILARGPVTLELTVMSVIIGLLIALPIGIYSAMRQDTVGDYIARSFAIACLAIPSFWLATMVIVFPSIWWNYMPPITYTRFIDDPIRNLQMLIVPALILGLASAGAVMRMTRTMMLEVLRQDYIRTAWAKGLKEKVVIAKHALKNALIPIVTIVGLWIPYLLGGSVIIEDIFVLPGLGRLLIQATLTRDYTVISATTFFFASVMILANLITDLTYALLDPRIRYT